MFSGKATVHSCYGSGNPDCGDKNYWKGFKSTNDKGVDIPDWKPVIEPKPKQ